MISELLGIGYNIEKARVDGKVQNLASYINEKSLTAVIKKFIEIIKKFLKAGIMEDGKYLDSEKGTPQGNGASPVLANIYIFIMF